MQKNNPEINNKTSVANVFISLVVTVGLVFLFIFVSKQELIELSKKLLGEGNLTIVDDDGIKWMMLLDERSKDFRELQGECAGEGEGVKYVTPINLKAKVSVSGKILYLSPDISGKAGERYFPSVYKNGRRQSPPSYNIYNEKDELIGGDKFAFG